VILKTFLEFCGVSRTFSGDNVITGESHYDGYKKSSKEGSKESSEESGSQKGREESCEEVT